MYFQPSKGEVLLHANVYHDNGEVCHPVLEPREGQPSIKLSIIFKKIYQMIYEPNFNNAANLFLANQQKTNK